MTAPALTADSVRPPPQIEGQTSAACWSCGAGTDDNLRTGLLSPLSKRPNAVTTVAHQAIDIPTDAYPDQGGLSDRTQLVKDDRAINASALSSRIHAEPNYQDSVHRWTDRPCKPVIFNWGTIENNRRVGQTDCEVLALLGDSSEADSEGRYGRYLTRRSDTYAHSQSRNF